MDSQVLVALGLSLVGGLSTSIGALIVVLNPAPNLKMLGLLQGFAAGLMLSISFLDLAHNAINSIGFLKGNIWFYAGVISFGIIVKFIPEPTLVPETDGNKRKEDDGSGKDLMKKHRRQVLYSGIITAVGISLHNFPEGMAVFLGSIKGLRVGINLALAIALHNIPEIAVKKLKIWSNKAEKEFAVEVQILGSVRHKNLLSLRGYCAEGLERLIVYDYMPNVSLLSHLHGQHSYHCLLTWERRMNIAVGAAEGLAYLHHHATPHIIHRDVKASNVLLDANFEARVADFGFAKLIPEGATHVTTRVKGTLGYLAPEYAMYGKAKKSCDVYSFGILLLELASGKRPLEKVYPKVKRSIVEWALPLVKEKKFEQVADSKLNGKYVEEEMKRVVVVALVCAQNDAEKRPSMVEVVELLNGGMKDKFASLEMSDLFAMEQSESGDGSVNEIVVIDS